MHTDTRSWEFPYCVGCVTHVKAAKNAEIAAGFVGGGSILILMYCAFGLGQAGLGLFLSAAGVGFAIFLYNAIMSKAKSMCSSTCASVKSAVGYHGWQGACHMFEVISPNYALAFMMTNQKKLVNVRPEVWQWLQANGFSEPLGDKPQSAKRYMT